MKCIRLLTTTIAAFFVSVSTMSAATFNINYSFGGHSLLVASTSTALLVSDTAGDGFVGVTDPNGSPGSIASFSLAMGSGVDDDVVLAAMTAQTIGGAVVGFDSGALTFDTTNPLWGGRLGSGQSLGLYFFPNGSNAVGSNGYFYRSDIVTDPAYGANSGYVTPNASQTVTILTLTDNVSLFGGAAGGVPQAAVDANGFLVPEPSVALMTLFGASVLFVRRRK